MRNYSKQREVIVEVLRSTDTHPTVQWVYEKCREKLPKISLGTVYRNLTELKKDGDVLELSVGDGFQHYDGDVKEHMHFYCHNCGAILDCEVPKNNLKDFLQNKLSCEVDLSGYVFSGLCSFCINTNNK